MGIPLFDEALDYVIPSNLSFAIPNFLVVFLFGMANMALAYGASSATRVRMKMVSKAPAAQSADIVDLPKGINAIRQLPAQSLDDLWQSIVVEETVKTQLLAQALLNFTVRGKVERTVLPLHGVILLVGPPGTGKTSLARGLASRVAGVLGTNDFKLLEVDPHALTSSAMGKTQRAVADLFSQTVAEHASTGRTIVLLDEVETLAADRSKMSLEANPIDIHRATDAVLVQLDLLAESHPNLLFVATSNFPQAVDAAFTSRCDLVLEVPLPDAQALRTILTHCLSGLSQTYPAVESLVGSAGMAKLATACVGMDGRAIRKLVINALAMRKETAIDPNQLEMKDLLAAAASARLHRVADKGGAA
ncbi:SpoVK/Ycf46/Vps4 family AAA+-type ATPase [Variovorax boronicumulans]|uniref:AAA family ATPase n=1 Tax=Variovorax boronicumulans TaxID=436515 RepID=UPI0034748865